MKNVLVTGGNGFIGSHLVDRLASQPDTNVIVLDIYPRIYDTLPEGVNFVQGSLNDMGLIRRIIQDYNIKIIYHVAWANIAETSLKNVIADLENNLIPTINLLEVCKDTEIEKFIFLSSGGAVYGLPCEVPLPENHPTNPINAYGVTKLTVEKYIRMYGHLYGLKYAILRPSVPYGPRQNPHRRQGVISVFIHKALQGDPVTIWGNGDQIIRDYFYISDLVDAMIRAQDLQLDQEMVYNLGGQKAYSLNDITRIIGSVLNIPIQIRQEPGRGFDVSSLVLDSSQARQTLGWEPQISIEQGILKTAQWIKENILYG